ncbi:MAG: hypothetical protein DMD78_23840 [Candidatus Rokuibacteriota bacterium]|nr:MAG: hypothetical protein DMD78_23840 [Candidatus Rokubacteria bacterium]
MLADALTLVVTWAVYLAVLGAAAYVVTWPLLWGVSRLRSTPGRTRGWRPWLAWVLAAAFAALAALPLYANVERRARVAKAQGDVLLLGKALAVYAAHCGGPPAAGADGTDCPVATTPQTGAVPRALLTAQRSARGLQARAALEFIRGCRAAGRASAACMRTSSRPSAARACAPPATAWSRTRAAPPPVPERARPASGVAA